MPETESTPVVVQFIKDKAVSSKKFVKKHRVSIAVTVTSIVWSSAMVKSARGLNEFLDEHDLLEKYYDVEDDPEEAAALRGK